MSIAADAVRMRSHVVICRLCMHGCTCDLARILVHCLVVHAVLQNMTDGTLILKLARQSLCPPLAGTEMIDALKAAQEWTVSDHLTGKDLTSVPLLAAALFATSRTPRPLPIDRLADLQGLARSLSLFVCCLGCAGVLLALPGVLQIVVGAAVVPQAATCMRICTAFHPVSSDTCPPPKFLMQRCMHRDGADSCPPEPWLWVRRAKDGKMASTTAVPACFPAGMGDTVVPCHARACLPAGRREECTPEVGMWTSITVPAAGSCPAWYTVPAQQPEAHQSCP